MRVALVAPYDLAVPGGVQAQVLGLARALSTAGDQVLVVAPGHPSRWPLGEPIGAAGARIATAGAGPTLVVPVNGSRAPVARSPLAGVRTRAALAAFAPDVVHVHEPFVPGPALAAARTGLAPVVGTFHRAGADRAYRLLGPAFASLARRLAARVAVSEAARATLESVVGALWAGVEILPNAVDLARAAEARADPFPSPGTTVVFVGRHERRKGLEVLLEAFSLLEGEASLWVVGDGPLRRELEARHAGARICFLGRLGDREADRRVAGADVLVAPSLGGESFGVVLLEAMAAGTAVIASDLPGYRLAGGDAARYVPPGSPTALAAGIGELLADRAAREGLAAEGLARASGHGFEALAARYRLRYQACSSRPGHAGP